MAILDRVNDERDPDSGEVFLAARIVPGEWARMLWETGLRQTGLLARQALAYDPYRERPERWLARYLALASAGTPVAVRHTSGCAWQPCSRTRRSTAIRLVHNAGAIALNARSIACAQMASSVAGATRPIPVSAGPPAGSHSGPGCSSRSSTSPRASSLRGDRAWAALASHAATPSRHDCYAIAAERVDGLAARARRIAAVGEINQCPHVTAKHLTH